MKTITSIVVITSLLVLGLLYSRRPGPDVPTVVIPSSEASPLHPLAIDALRERQFPPQKLNVESKISDNISVVSYLSDGSKLYALMIIPAGTPPENGWPVVVVNHGYIPPNDFRTTSSYINTSRYFASQGFLVLKPDYRGHDRSEGKSSGRLLSRAEYTIDVLNLLSAVGSVDNADSGRIFMYGHSLGGEVTLQVLAASTKVKAATLWAPAVTTFPDAISHFLTRRRPTPGQIEEFRLQYEDFITRYPISQITSIDNLSRITAPINIHHSPTDESVPYSWGEALNDKLKTLNLSVNFYSYPNDNHDLAKNFTTALSRDAEFFKSIP